MKKPNRTRWEQFELNRCLMRHYVERITLDANGRYKGEVPQFPEIKVYARNLETLFHRLYAAKRDLFKQMIADGIRVPCSTEWTPPPQEEKDDENLFPDLTRRIAEITKRGY